MTWRVAFTGKAAKQARKLPIGVANALSLLVAELELSGPVRGNWRNYSKLGPARHHCHLKRGKPTYVAIWEETEDGVRIIEVTYVGTHEKAPY